MQPWFFLFFHVSQPACATFPALYFCTFQVFHFFSSHYVAEIKVPCPFLILSSGSTPFLSMVYEALFSRAISLLLLASFASILRLSRPHI